MRILILVIGLMFSLNVLARFGGSRSGGFRSSGFSRSSSFSSSRSYSFGGGRSSGSSATISRPSSSSWSRSRPAPVYHPPSQPSTVRETHVIHNNSGPGFGTGLLMGHMMGSASHGHAAPVVVQPGVAAPMIEGAPMVTTAQVYHSPSYYILWTLLWVFLLGIIFRFIYCVRNELNFWGE